jgi:hypothetical protein
MSSESPPAEWYPDPYGAGLRWWDGVQWTSYTHPGTVDRVTTPNAEPADFVGGDVGSITDWAAIFWKRRAAGIFPVGVLSLVGGRLQFVAGGRTIFDCSVSQVEFSIGSGALNHTLTVHVGNKKYALLGYMNKGILRYVTRGRRPTADMFSQVQRIRDSAVRHLSISGAPAGVTPNYGFGVSQLVGFCQILTNNGVRLNVSNLPQESQHLFDSQR